MLRTLRVIALIAAAGLVCAGIGACINAVNPNNPEDTGDFPTFHVVASVKSLAKGTGVPGVTVTFSMGDLFSVNCVTGGDGTCVANAYGFPNGSYSVRATKGNVTSSGGLDYVQPGNSYYEFLTNAFD